MPSQQPKAHSSLEDTISIYRNKYLTDLDDENDDAPIQRSRDASTKVVHDDSHQQQQQQFDDHRYNDSDDSETDECPQNSDSNDNVNLTGSRARKSKLPKDLAGLMGQANVSFARGEFNDAILMCQEVIRLAPKCPEPFISLAEHYSEIEADEEKAEQLYLIAAYLQPSNTHLWVKVAESATKRREFRLAATCYTKAIRSDKSESCIAYHLKRCNLYEQLGDQKKALKGYENLIAISGPEDEQIGLELARGISRIYFNDNKIDSCIRTLEGALDKYPGALSGEDLTKLAASYNFKENYTKTIDLMVRNCNVKVLLDDNESWDCSSFESRLEGQNKPTVSMELQPDNPRFTFSNVCQLTIAFISLNYIGESIQPLVDIINSSTISVHRQHLYDVAKAYYLQGAYEEARDILFKLTKLRDSQLASVWLLYSQCLKNLHEIDEAIAGYHRVLSYEPDDYSSRLALSNLLSVQGRHEEALTVTRQSLSDDKPVDIPLLYQSCKLLEQAEDWDEYCKSAQALLLTDMTYTHHSKEMMCMITSRSFRTRQDNLRSVQRELNQNPSKSRRKGTGAKLDSNSMIQIFLKYIEVLFHMKKDYQELKRICLSAYTCPAFECFESSIDFYSTAACVCSNDREFTYTLLKILASRNPDNYQVWNLLSMAMSNIYQDLRHAKFCLRQFTKNPEVLPLAILNGHNNLISGSYKHALGEYMSILRERPNDAFIAFCVALTFLSLSCQKYVSSKNLCLFQMMAFFQVYLELRGSCQEAMYNIGRAFHQVSMLDKAVIFYRKALEYNDKTKIRPLHESNDEFDEIFDVRREAAFNLALIYKNSQSYGLAHQVIKDNFTI